MSKPPVKKTNDEQNKREEDEQKKREEIDPEAFEQTIVMERREPVTQTAAEAQPDESYEATIVLPKHEAAEQPAAGDEDYDTTVILSKHQPAPPPTAQQKQDEDETTLVRPPAPQPSTAFEDDSQATTVVSRPSPAGAPQARKISDDFAVADAEQRFYQDVVKGGHVGGKYDVEGLLAKGGMGAIFNVVEQDLHRRLAMKVLLPALKTDPTTLNSFVTEAQINGYLEHPSIMPIHELGLLPETGLFFTMKLAQGESLKDIITQLKAGDPASVEQYTTYHLLSIFRKVCDALSYAHSMHVLHLDVKPHNIIVGDYGEVLLMDWGLATVFGTPDEEPDPVKQAFIKHIGATLQTKGHHIEGSPTFMSPEQARGQFELLDPRSDIFLLGATLYHMFTLEAPYFGNDLYEVLHKAEQRDLVPPDDRAPSRQIPPEVCRIIMTAMAADPAERYQTVNALSQDVDDLLAGKWTQQDTVEFTSGDMLIQEGEVGQEAYMILQGSAMIMKTTEDGKTIILRTCGPGEILGEMALLSDEPRSASVQAVEDTKAAVLTKEVISQNLRKLPPYMEKIVSTLTQRLSSISERVHPHLSVDCTYVVLKHLRLLFRDSAENLPLQNLSMPYDALVAEIAEDLGLPQQRVIDVFTQAEKMGLIVQTDHQIRIGNLPELLEFTGYSRRLNQVAGMLNEDREW